MNVKTMTRDELAAAHREHTALKLWRTVNTIERELKDRAPVELAQDSYYYGTAADFVTKP